MRFILAFLFFPLGLAAQQIQGIILDDLDNQVIPGAKILSSENQKCLSNPDGSFTLNYGKLPLTLFIQADSFQDDTLLVLENKVLEIRLKARVIEQDMMVVTAARRKQNIEEVPISLEILKPRLINNKGITDLEQAVDQSPGVYAMDGQVSIRGGSGFAYGAGSRVLLLWNGIPLVSADAGDAKWNAIPLESAAQIEILKGASSVLYGSGALNGIISITEKEPGLKQETRLKIQHGVYGNPARESLRWWDKNPTFQLVDFYTGKMYKRVGYTFSSAGFTSKGYRQGEIEQRMRTSGTLFFRFAKLKNLKAGVGYNMQFQKAGNFIIWQSDSLAYTPNGGADTSQVTSTLTYNRGIRISVDPYLKYIDSKKNLHSLKTRWYYVDNQNLNRKTQNSISQVYYADYQFQKKWSANTILTSGTSFTGNSIRSSTFGDHHSENWGIYTQFEKKIKRVYLTAGIRFEYFSQDNHTGDSDFYFGKDSSKIPLFPIIRMAGSYEVAKFTHLRASFGQGVRYPTIAERYTETSVGSLNIFPNPNLKRETGWAAEVGIKQGVKLGTWKGLLDLAAFVNQYDNMMEFTFGFYLPDSLTPSVNPNDPGYIPNWFGFKATNAEKARISGLEFSFNCEGKIKQVEINALMGYTYMNPISLNVDSTYRSTFSDTSGNMLKYRFRHLAKADVEAVWKGFTIGTSMRYSSFMKNIDKVFEEGGGAFEILPGLKTYRETHNKGVPVFDARLGYSILDEQYRFFFIVNNVFNAEYVTRPGDIQAPRTFMVQVQMKF